MFLVSWRIDQQSAFYWSAKMQRHTSWSSGVLTYRRACRRAEQMRRHHAVKTVTLVSTAALYRNLSALEKHRREITSLILQLDRFLLYFNWKRRDVSSQLWIMAVLGSARRLVQRKCFYHSKYICYLNHYISVYMANPAEWTAWWLEWHALRVRSLWRLKCLRDFSSVFSRQLTFAHIKHVFAFPRSCAVSDALFTIFKFTNRQQKAGDKVIHHVTQRMLSQLA